MGFLGKAIKGGLAVKAAEVVREQLAKRSNRSGVATPRPSRIRTRGR